MREIVGWRYGPPFEFYDGDGEAPLNPERFFEARDEAGSLVGFYYFEKRGDAMFYGLGLRPELTGRGLGFEFVRRGLEYGREHLGLRRVILDVAAFNQRAIKVYARAGFRETGRKMRTFPRWGEVEFVDMELREDPRP
jgi:aminoglycoside 6'-N-acetyltransferase/ribosomal-protein-alanine N-acetyltransferase